MVYVLVEYYLKIYDTLKQNCSNCSSSEIAFDCDQCEKDPAWWKDIGAPPIFKSN